MKLSKVAAVLDENLEALETTLSSVRNISDKSKNLYTVYYLEPFRRAVKNIDKAGLFPEQIERLYNGPIFSNALPNFDLSVIQLRDFRSAATTIYNAGIALHDAVDKSLPKEHKTNISVKLPEFQTFDEFIKILEKLNKAFSLTVLHPSIDGAVIIESLEPGSKWININVVSTAAATLIGSLVYAGCLVNEQINKNAKAVEELRTMDLQNDALEKVVSAQNNYVDIMLHTEAQHIYNENFIGDPEQEVRVMNSIKLFSEIIHMGGEIHPALSAPEVIKASFPDKPPHLLKSKTKMIEQNAGASSE